jgi:hypothetical protein
MGDFAVRILDAGFAISAETRDGIFIPDLDLNRNLTREEANPDEGWYSDDTSALVLSNHGASGVVDVSKYHDHSNPRQRLSKGKHAMIIHADPNTYVLGLP